MNIKIIKTSKQAKLENEKYKTDSMCPECKNPLNIGCYYYESKGFLRGKRKVTSYKCLDCGCEWEAKD